MLGNNHEALDDAVIDSCPQCTELQEEVRAIKKRAVRKDWEEESEWNLTTVGICGPLGREGGD